jgi:tRNA1Val (adenine37-N6)-methyltransferase
MDNIAAHNPRLFRLKQFSLSDSGCGMKIGTDGILLGAVSAKTAAQLNPATILDIGTGCGLVALMIAQQCQATIDAIDIDSDAVATAFQNFLNSPWPTRLKALKCPLQDFTGHVAGGYDIICCNPPYFQNSMPGSTHSRTLARHNLSLDFNELFLHSSRLISPTGSLIVIYPADLVALVSQQSSLRGFHEYRQLHISPNPSTPVKRIISHFSLTPSAELVTERMAIETGERHCFSEEYRELTKEYHPFFNG